MKAYVVTLSSLPRNYSFVQGAHALAELVHTQKDQVKQWIENHKTLVFTRSPNLDKVIDALKQSNLIYAVFNEPDLGNQLTAVACVAATTPDIIKTMALL